MHRRAICSWVRFFVYRECDARLYIDLIICILRPQNGLTDPLEATVSRIQSLLDHASRCPCSIELHTCRFGLDDYFGIAATRTTCGRSCDGGKDDDGIVQSDMVIPKKRKDY